MNELLSLEGRCALVTGGSPGIDRMIAKSFLAQGARVYISSRKAAVCQGTAAELSSLGPCFALPADVFHGPTPSRPHQLYPLRKNFSSVLCQ